MATKRYERFNSGFSNPTTTSINMSTVMTELKGEARRGRHLSQAEKSGIARGEKPLPAQIEHLESCESCTGYIVKMKLMLAGEQVKRV